MSELKVGDTFMGKKIIEVCPNGILRLEPTIKPNGRKILSYGYPKSPRKTRPTSAV